MTADDKYSLSNSENLQQPVHMQLFKQQKVFSQFLAAFLKTISHFQHVRNEMFLIAYVFPKLETANPVVRKMPKKINFKTPFNSQHAKGSQTLLKSAVKHFYHFLNHSEGYSVGNCHS